MSAQTRMDNCLSRASQCLHQLSEQSAAILLLQEACRTYISSAASIVPCRAGVVVSRTSQSVCKIARLASSTMSCRHLPVLESVAVLLIT